MLGQGWINDKFSDSIAYIKQKECKNTEDVDIILKKEGYTRTSEIFECTMKHRIGYHIEFGDDGYWAVCDPSERGASKFYYCQCELTLNEIGCD